MWIPLPVRLLCFFAISIVGWSATKGFVRSGVSTSNGIVLATSEEKAPNLGNAASAITVKLTPVRGGVTVTQALQLTASVQNDSSNSGVRWSSSGGIVSNQTSHSATFTARAAGTYTITVTSKADPSKSAVASIGVTDLAG